jgi:hypothetical protein
LRPCWTAPRALSTSGQPYSGYWRVGGDNLGGWPNQPASNYLSGSIDEVSIYPTALTKDQVMAQYLASGRTSPIPAAPADTYGAAIYNAQPDLFWRLADAPVTRQPTPVPRSTRAPTTVASPRACPA